MRGADLAPKGTSPLAEIAQMQDWLQEWYDLPGGRPVGTA